MGSRGWGLFFLISLLQFFGDAHVLLFKACYDQKDWRSGRYIIHTCQTWNGSNSMKIAAWVIERALLVFSCSGSCITSLMMLISSSKI